MITSIAKIDVEQKYFASPNKRKLQMRSGTIALLFLAIVTLEATPTLAVTWKSAGNRDINGVDNAYASIKQGATTLYSVARGGTNPLCV